MILLFSICWSVNCDVFLNCFIYTGTGEVLYIGVQVFFLFL